MTALYFWARWVLANALLNTSTGFARLARRMAPRPARMDEEPAATGAVG